ncbi:MAG: putative lipoprotein signal peptide [Myxococcaceae bacterium]|nr:putative lipoprotein signal peptide [Myxococcaceae bacterium]
MPKLPTFFWLDLPLRACSLSYLGALGCLVFLGSACASTPTNDNSDPATQQQVPDEVAPDGGSVPGSSARGDAGSSRNNPVPDAGTSHMGGSDARVNGTTHDDAASVGGPGPTDSSAANPPATNDASAPSTPAKGCTANLLPLPDDMKARGPWDVGVKTLKIGRLTVEAFYPAKPGSTDGVAEAAYDIRLFLPKTQQKLIPDSASPLLKAVGGHVYRDVPLDGDHGPYPVVVFIHGTASFRVASLSTNAHWASRGIVVLAADYPGLGLADTLVATGQCSADTATGAQDLPGDVNAQIAALKAPSGDTQFFAGHVDTTRLGVSGHSQGACISATLSSLPGVRIVLPLDGSTAAAASDSLESIFYASGMADSVIGYDFPLIGNTVCPLFSTDSKDAYNGSPGAPKVKKRLLGVTGGGHLVPTDLCAKNAAGNNAVQEATNRMVCGVTSAVIIGLPALNDCGTISDYKVGLEAINYGTAAALEETLLCQDRSKQFADLKKNLPQVGDFEETLK